MRVQKIKTIFITLTYIQINVFKEILVYQTVKNIKHFPHIFKVLYQQHFNQMYTKNAVVAMKVVLSCSSAENSCTQKWIRLKICFDGNILHVHDKLLLLNFPPYIQDPASVIVVTSVSVGMKVNRTGEL